MFKLSLSRTTIRVSPTNAPTLPLSLTPSRTGLSFVTEVGELSLWSELLR